MSNTINSSKKVVAIHDLSGFGKCSLTVALPILSAAGMETSAIPTAILSTYVGEFEGYTYRDLTDDLPDFVGHWKKHGLEFDSLYSGFLGSLKQVEVIRNIFDALKPKNGIIMVDPVMADHGKLYATFPKEFPAEMKKLCQMADIIVPNITEACLLIGEEYKEGPYTKEYIEHLLHKLSKIGAAQIVLTGVHFDEETLGVGIYDQGKIAFELGKRIPIIYHGTGDIFSSALLGALLSGFDLQKSCQIAINFIVGAIDRNYRAKVDHRFGVLFEQELPHYLELLEKR